MKKPALLVAGLIIVACYFLSSAAFSSPPVNSRTPVGQDSGASVNKSYLSAPPTKLSEIEQRFGRFGTRIEILSMNPLLLLIHDFLSPELCDCIVAEACEKGLDKSTILNDKDEYSGRTSSTVWLQDKHEASEVNKMAKKVQKMSGIPISHQENLQVIRYQLNQQYTLHTDHMDEFNELEVGGRLATCLMYLNDDFTGGETDFPELKVTVSPKKGSALFWYNVKLPAEDPWKLQTNFDLLHAGLPVTHGIKWACNKWIHPVPIPPPEGHTSLLPP